MCQSNSHFKLWVFSLLPSPDSRQAVIRNTILKFRHSWSIYPQRINGLQDDRKQILCSNCFSANDKLKQNQSLICTGKWCCWYFFLWLQRKPKNSVKISLKEININPWIREGCSSTESVIKIKQTHPEIYLNFYTQMCLISSESFISLVPAWVRVSPAGLKHQTASLALNCHTTLMERKQLGWDAGLVPESLPERRWG